MQNGSNRRLRNSELYADAMSQIWINVAAKMPNMAQCHWMDKSRASFFRYSSVCPLIETGELKWMEQRLVFSWLNRKEFFEKVVPKFRIFAPEVETSVRESCLNFIEQPCSFLVVVRAVYFVARADQQHISDVLSSAPVCAAPPLWKQKRRLTPPADPEISYSCFDELPKIELQILRTDDPPEDRILLSILPRGVRAFRRGSMPVREDGQCWE